MHFRGSTIHFSTPFIGADNEPATPTTAKVYLKFTLAAGGKGSQTLDLSDDGQGNWKASWDSSVAKAGLVEWSVRATDGTENIADDGSFTLSANRANPLPPPAP